jgi:hypothetical protein
MELLAWEPMICSLRIFRKQAEFAPGVPPWHHPVPLDTEQSFWHPVLDRCVSP